MKKIFAFALVLVLALSLLTACGEKDNGGSNTGGNSNTPASTPNENNADSTPPASQGGNDSPSFIAGEWPDNDWTKQVPKPTAGTIGEIYTKGDKDQTLTIEMDWTREEAEAYAAAAQDAGFTVDAYAYYKDSPSMSVLLEAKNSAGYEIGVSEVEIKIVKP